MTKIKCRALIKTKLGLLITFFNWLRHIIQQPEIAYLHNCIIMTRCIFVAITWPNFAVSIRRRLLVISLYFLLLFVWLIFVSFLNHFCTDKYYIFKLWFQNKWIVINELLPSCTLYQSLGCGRHYKFGILWVDTVRSPHSGNNRELLLGLYIADKSWHSRLKWE